jgi:hypothetical protein
MMRKMSVALPLQEALVKIPRSYPLRLYKLSIMMMIHTREFTTKRVTGTVILQGLRQSAVRG